MGFVILYTVYDCYVHVCTCFGFLSKFPFGFYGFAIFVDVWWGLFGLHCWFGCRLVYKFVVSELILLDLTFSG